MDLLVLPPAVAASVRSQLEASHHRSRAFAGLVADYAAALRAARDLDVRGRQLEREAGELRAENDTLVAQAQGAASAMQLREAEAAAAALREELVGAYRDRGAAAEAAAAALRQLEVVRQINASQGAELAECQGAARRARAEAAALRQQVGRLEAARDAATAELQARSSEAAAAASRCSALEEEARDLVQRVLELKDGQAERMNEMNALREDTLAEARRQAADIVARAVASARAGLPRSALGASPRSLDASMRGLDLAAAEAGGPQPLPSTLLRA